MKMKYFYGISAALVATTSAQDPILQYVTAASTSTPAITASLVDPSLTAAQLTAGSGLSANAGSTFNWSGWDIESVAYADAVAAGDFLTWGFTATADVTVSGMEIRLDRSNSGPANFEIQASVNGGAPVSILTDGGTLSAVGEEFSVDLSAIGNLTSGDSVVFTLAAFNSSSSGGTFDLENGISGAAINILGSSSIATISVSTNLTSYGEGYGDEAEIFVSRTGDLSESLVVNLTEVADGDANADISLPASITIFAGESENFDFFEIIDDTEIEGFETVTIEASATGFAATTTEFTIADNEGAVLVVNEFLADPPVGVDVNGDGSADTSEDEFVELFNVSDVQLDLSGWTVSDGVSVRHTFPEATLLEPGCALVVTGGGTDVPTMVGTTEVQVATSGALGLNNGGDSITIADAASTVISSLSYGNEAGNDESINLDPDFVEGDTYVAHSLVANAVGSFSFGTTVDGSDPCATEFLNLTFDVATVSETAANPAVTGTVTRTGGDNASALTVSLSSLDLTELTVPETVEIPAGSASATFPVSVVDDSEVDGDRVATIVATGFLVGTGQAELTVTDAGDTFTPPALLALNEIWADDAGTDNVEYVELFGTPGASLSGLSLVVISGGSGFENFVNYSYEFTTEAIPSDGFFLIAAGLDSEADVIAPANFLPDFSVTYALVPTADLYVENSYITTDSLTAMGSSVLDAVAVSNNASPTVYFGATEILSNSAGFPYDLVYRLADGAGDTEADWGTQDHFTDSIEYGDSNDLLSTAGSSNSMIVSDYTVTISDCSYSAGQFVINFTASGSSDIYVSADLTTWAEATNGAGVASGTYTDTAPPTGKAFYQIQEAGTPAP